MLKQRNATAYSWASCNLVCTLKFLKHLCLFSPSFARKWHKGGKIHIAFPLSPLSWNVKEFVGQNIFTSRCQQDLGLLDILDTPGNNDQSALWNGSVQQSPRFWRRGGISSHCPSLGWSSYFCLALSPFPHTHQAMVHVLPLNATVSTWLKTEACLIKMLGGPELDSFGFLLISLGLRLWTGLIHWATYGASWFNRICPFPRKVSALPALHEKAYP